MKSADMVGFEQGRLKVIKRAGNKNGKALWECECECGNLCYYTTTQLRHYGVNSCGCIQREKAAELAPVAGRKRQLINGSCLNSFNSKIGENNTSGVKGVSFYKKSGKWKVQIRYSYKNYYFGLYEKIEDAAEVRREAEQFIKEHFNNPEEIEEYFEKMKG